MFTYWLDGGTADNEQTNPDALHKLSEEVEEMLATKLFRNRRYFSKQGRNMSMTMSNYISDDSMSVISSLAEYDD